MGLLQDASKTDCLLSIYAGFVLHAHCNQALWSLWALFGRFVVSGKCEEVLWSSGCLCNFMANCIVSMQKNLFT